MECAIRPFDTLDEYQECVRLQEEVWGKGFSEKVPVAILMIARKFGGVSAGAYDGGGRLLGFVFGITGLEGNEPVHYSDMLAVRPEVRDRGLGVRLKAHQRSEMLARGVRRSYWSFDPLQAKNAYFNFAKLGVLVREYVPEMYGDTGSPLHRGLGTDRFIAEWNLASRRVRERIEGTADLPGLDLLDHSRGILGVRSAGSLPAPGTPRLGREDELLRLPIPSRIGLIQREEPALARAWREATREAVIPYLRRGYTVRDFVRGEALSHYLLAPLAAGEVPE